MDIALVRRIEELGRLSAPALKESYREVFGCDPRCSHKQYLYRRIVWQLQAQAEGGLNERVLRRASEIADDADLRVSGEKGFWSWPGKAPNKTASRRDSRLPEPGTVLKRRYQGHDIKVKVLAVGFEYQSRHYRSLSAIAREITGTRWNGLLFFGLTERQHG